MLTDTFTTSLEIGLVRRSNIRREPGVARAAATLHKKWPVQVVRESEQDDSWTQRERDFPGMSTWQEHPKHAEGIMYLVWLGNASGFPRKS